MQIVGAPMEQAISVGAMVFHRHRLEPLDPHRLPLLTLASHMSGPVTLGTIQYSAGARVVSETVPRSYQVNIPLSGTLRTGTSRQLAVATPTRAVQYGLQPHSLEGFDTPTRVRKGWRATISSVPTCRRRS